ncbi:MAG: hypothetical protein IPM00_16395 [Tetrasphaera sp.]|nr:hypothetical protein [Tetrasphaera sp.]
MAVGEPPPRGPSRRPTWVIVVATLGTVAVAIGLFVAGLVVGIAVSQTTPGTQNAGPQATVGGTAGASSLPGAAGALDACVVGTWRSTEHEESADVKDQGPVTVSGMTRTLVFTADGQETVTYDRAEATISVKDGTARIVYDGTVTYHVTTSGGSMAFTLGSVDGTVTVTGSDGKSQSQPLKPGTGSVSYTCSPDRLTQEAPGFHSVYERVG